MKLFTSSGQSCPKRLFLSLDVKTDSLLNIKLNQVDGEVDYSGCDFDFDIYLDYIEKWTQSPSLLSLIRNANNEIEYTQIAKGLKEKNAEKIN